LEGKADTSERIPYGSFRITLEPVPGIDDSSTRKVLAISPIGQPRDVELGLYSDIAATKTILLGAFSGPRDVRKFNDLLEQLFWIARTGLETPGYPAVATIALSNFRSDILAVEATRIKNNYMQRLGLWTAGFAVKGLLLLGLLQVSFSDGSTAAWRTPFEKLCLLWSGAMVGCWLSFGIRHPQLTFASLAAPDTDLLLPPLRALFTGLLTLTLGLAFMTGLVSLTIGEFSTTSLTAASILDPTGVVTLLLIGLFCGISEQALSATVGNQAAKILPGDKK